MLRGNIKNKLIYGGTLLAVFSLTIGSAMAGEIGPDTAAGAKKLGDARLTCNQMDPAYMSPRPPGPPQPDQAKHQVCTKCQQAVDQQKQKIEAARTKAIQENNAVVGAGSAGTSAIGSATTGQQQNTQNNASGTNNVGNSAQAQRAAIAKALAQEAQSCSSQVQNSCNGNLAAADKQAAEAASQGCNEVANASNANAAEKTASGSTMGDMSQLASALGQALGPLAQMMQGQPETPMDPGITETPSTIAPPAGTSLGNTPLAGTSIGNSNSPNGAEFKAPKNNITGFGPAGSGNFSPSTGYDSLAGGGSDDGSGGGTSVGAGYSSGGGSTGLNSSGSSMAPGSSDAEKAAAAAAAEAAGENYEISAMGGGGSKPSFLGLKSRAEEDLAAGESVLGDLGLSEEGSRELASNDEPMGGIGQADGNTLFHVIHTKIAEIKKRGSI